VGDAVVNRNIRIGWNLPGTFTRLGLHMGMIWQWVYSGLPLPTLAVGTSVGGLILACCISFDKKILRKVARLVINLKKEQMFRLSPALIHTGLHLIAAPCLLFASCIAAVVVKGPEPWYLAWASWLTLAAGVCGMVILIRRAIRLFFKMESPLDTTPLFNLLYNNLAFAPLFQAKTELRIVTADVITPDACVFSNHEPRMTDPHNPQHCARFVDIIRGSTALPGRFPVIRVDGKCLQDAEVWTDFPINEFRGECDIVFRFDYWEALRPSPEPRNWLLILLRCFDIMRDKNTRETMEKYQVEQPQHPDMPRVVTIRASETLLRQIPESVFYGFNPKQLIRAIRVGQRIVKENLPMIRRELGIDEETESVA
jgi:hypothetical protein